MSNTHVKILKAARARIQSGAHRFVCFAVDPDFGYTDRFSKASITGWIESSLGRPSSLEGWLLKNKHIKNFKELQTDVGRAKLKATRLAWIDWMIENHHVFDKGCKFD